MLNSSEKNRVKIGTSGIVLPGAKAAFPIEFQAGSRLHYYASLFNTLEINSSFYKIPMPSTFAKWAAEVPDNFKFTVKLWREITHPIYSHSKKLAHDLDDIDRFMHAANHLHVKRGCLLIQFPASITFSDQKAVEKILRRLHQLNSDHSWQLAVELRHSSWYQQEAYSLFDQYKATVVIHDMPASATPATCPLIQCIYCRLHGPTGNYDGSYADEFIYQYAQRIKNWNAQNFEVYVYFNNTIGSAFANAQLLQTLL